MEEKTLAYLQSLFFESTDAEHNTRVDPKRSHSLLKNTTADFLC